MHFEPGPDHSREQLRPADVDADCASGRHMQVTIFRGPMPDEPDRRAHVDDPPYRVYRAGGRSGAQKERLDSPGRGDGGRPPGGAPYRTYRARPRALDALLGRREELTPPGGPRRGPLRLWPWRRRRGPRKKITPLRVLKWLALAVVFWLLLSLILFII